MKVPFIFRLSRLVMYIVVFSVLTVSCQAEPKPLVPDPGVVSFTFRAQFAEDFTGTLDLIKEMGITNIEFSSLFGQTAADIRAMLDERGMVCTSLGVGYGALMNQLDQVIAMRRPVVPDMYDWALYLAPMVFLTWSWFSKLYWTSTG